MQWMIYGANGYSGRLIAAEAVRRGLKPVLAGRNEAALRALADELGLRWRMFTLDHPVAVREGLRDMALVLHCAGPFPATSAPMLEVCLQAGTHYLDITGEIDVFAHCHAQHERAREAGIVVLPGVGFDVVPSDCLAAQLYRECPLMDRVDQGLEPACVTKCVTHCLEFGKAEKLDTGRRREFAEKVAFELAKVVSAR